SIEAGGNVEVLVLAGVAGTYTMNLSDVQPTSRGGAILIDGGVQAMALTDAIRDGETTFTFDFSQTTATAGEAPGSSSVGGLATSEAIASTGAGAASVSPLNSLLVSQQNSIAAEAAGSPGPAALLGDVTPLSTLAASLVV